MATPKARTVTGRDIEDMKYPEVVFPRFTDQKPWQIKANFLQSQEEVEFPIVCLSHITHESESEGIVQTFVLTNGSFDFKPHIKIGKAYDNDGSPLGETFKEIGGDQYEEIPRSRDNPVFPGFLCWWGVDARDWDLDDLEYGQYPPGYLADPVGSSYGNKGFCSTLGDILRDYKESREDKQDKEVCLKVGGTLRYRYEICYVVMVCMEEDDVWGMPSITGPVGPFNPNGLVNDHGVVVDHNAVPTITLQSIVRSVRKDDMSGYDIYDWEQLVFSFYFPEPHQTLTCNNVGKYDVKHDPPKCTSSIPTRDGNLCPNKLNRPKVV